MADLEKLKKAIDEHLKREMEIARMILEADLTLEEWIELRKFIENHEWVRQVRSMFGVIEDTVNIRETMRKVIEEIFGIGFDRDAHTHEPPPLR